MVLFSDKTNVALKTGLSLLRWPLIVPFFVMLTKTMKPHMLNKVAYIKASRTSTMQH